MIREFLSARRQGLRRAWLLPETRASIDTAMRQTGKNEHEVVQLALALYAAATEPPRGFTRRDPERGGTTYFGVASPLSWRAGRADSLPQASGRPALNRRVAAREQLRAAALPHRDVAEGVPWWDVARHR